MSIPVAIAPLLEGKKGLIVGIANDQSIAWGCARAFRALGAELAITYLNEKAKRFVEPLAKEAEAPIFMPLDVKVPGQTEAVFDRIKKQWGAMDFLIHSIAFSPKEALHGRVVDVSLEGFTSTMEVSCWSFLRMAHLAEPLMKKGGSMFAMSYYGSERVVKNYNIMGVAMAVSVGYANSANVRSKSGFFGRAVLAGNSIEHAFFCSRFAMAEINRASPLSEAIPD